jgi:hypothetical protein
MYLECSSEESSGPTTEEVKRFMQRGPFLKDGSISLIDSKGYNLKVRRPT